MFGVPVVQARHKGRGERNEKSLEIRVGRSSSYLVCRRSIIALQRLESYVGEHGRVRDELQDGKPDADVLSSLHHRAAIFSDELLSIQTNLHPIVDESEERSERTRCHKDGDESKLKH